MLGSNSILSVGTAAARANIFVGSNETGAGTVVGLLDARQGQADIHALHFNVGYSGGGASTGTFKSGAQSTVDATSINIGTGNRAVGTFELTAGSVKAQTITLGSGGSFNFTGGRLSVGTFNSTLAEDGGVLAPDFSFGISTINGDYKLASAGTVELDLNGTTAGTLYDRLVVNGATLLDADVGLGGIFEVHLGYAARIGDSFLVLVNDGTDPIVGHFRGLDEGSQLSETFGGFTYSFRVSYLGGTGNDMTLEVIDVAAIPEPGSWALLLAGVGLIAARLRRVGLSQKPA